MNTAFRRKIQAATVEDEVRLRMRKKSGSFNFLTVET